jgi:hypothetical protein
MLLLYPEPTGLPTIPYRPGARRLTAPATHNLKRKWGRAGLAFADAEQLGAANGANALGRRPLVLQDDGLRVLDLSLGPALHAISLHRRTSYNVLLARVTNLLTFVNRDRLKNVKNLLNYHFAIISSPT